MHIAAVVVNPTKFTDPQPVHDQLAEIARLHDHELLWLETTEDDTGTGQADQAVAQGATLVCSLGGDGTVRAVATALVGTDTPIGLLPGGTGNLLARNLGLPIDSIGKAFEVALSSPERRIDVGRVRFDGEDEQTFLVMCGMGLDAEAMADTPEEVKKRIGWISYGITGARKLADRGIHVRVRSEHLTFTQHVRSVMVGNCGKIQGGIALLPDAELDDGQLDLLAFAPKGLTGWAAALWTLLTRNHGGHHTVRQEAAPSFEVQAKRPVEAEIDGDPVGRHLVMRTRVEAGALAVRSPR